MEELTTIRTAVARETGTRASPGAVVGGLAWTLRWLLLIILLILPLDAYLVLPPDRPIAFLSQILTTEALIVLGVAFALATLMRRPFPLAFDWRSVLPLAFVVIAGFLSVIAADVRAEAVKGCLKLLVYLGLFAIARAVAALPDIRRVALFITVLILCLVLVIGSLSTIPGMPDIAGTVLNIHRSSAALPGSDVLRAEATFRYPNELAAYLLIVLPLLMACAVQAHSRAERIGLWVIVAMGTWLLALTYTRGALVALLIVFPLLLWLIGGKKYGVAGLLVVLAVVGALVVQDGAQRNRLLTLLDPTGTGYSIRVAIWDWALHAFRTHPLFGVGIDNLKYQAHAPLANLAQRQPAVDAENLWLNILAEMGLAGAVAVAACFIGAFRRAWRGWQWGGGWIDQSWNAGTLGALCAILIYGLVDPVLVSGQVTGLLLVVVGLAGAESVTVTSEEPATLAPARATARTTLAPQPALAALAQQHRVLDDHAPPMESRVVFLMNSHGYGGAERHTVRLAADACARGVDVLVVCPPGSTLLPELEQVGIPYRVLPLGMSAGRWRGFLGTAMYFNPVSRHAFNHALAELSAETASIFVCPFVREQLLCAEYARQSGLRTVWVMHGPLHYLPHRWLLQPLQQGLAPWAAAIVPISRGLALRLAASGIPREHMNVIPNAVPEPALSQVEPLPRGATAGRGATIGVAARLAKGKGVQHLIAALPQIRHAYPDVELLIAGSGPYERNLRRQTHELGLDECVSFLGYRSDLAEFFASLSVFAYPTMDPGEVLPTAILEAMGAGVPVVASAFASIPEVVISGQTGVLVPDGQSAALAEAVIQLLSDRAHAQALAAAGRSKIIASHTFAQSGRSFLSLLQSLEDMPVVAMPGGTSGRFQTVQRSRFLRTTAVFFASKVLTALATSLWTILAARALLPRAYGNLMLAAGIVELGAIITDAGLTTVATRELANASYEQARALVGAIVAIKVALGLVAAAVIMAIALLVPMEHDARTALFVLGPSLLFVSLNSLTLVFRARVSAWQVLGVALLGALVTTYGTVLVYLRFPIVLNFAQMRLLAALASGLLALLLVLARYRPRLWADRVIVRRLLLAALPLGVALALNIAYYRLDVPLLAILRGSTQVATYTAAYRILDVITLLPGAAAAMALPLMSGIAQRGERHLAVFVTQYLEIAAACGLLLALLITLFGNALLAFLYAGKYAASGATLTVLGWVGAATFVTNVFAPLAIVLNRQRAFLLVAGMGLAINVAVNLALIPRWGSLGAASATLLTEIAISVPLAWIARKHLRLRFLTRPLVTVGVATVVALLCVAALHVGGGWEKVIKFGAVALWAALVFALAPRWVIGLATTVMQRDRLTDSFAHGRSPLTRMPAVPAPGEGER